MSDKFTPTPTTSKMSKFAQTQLEKMGWKEGQGLGKHRNGIKTNIKVYAKNDSTGVGLDKTVVECHKTTWWNDSMNSTLDKLATSNVGSKKSKKRKREESNLTSDELLFKATGGLKFGMRRAVRCKSSKEKEDLDTGADLGARFEWNGLADARIILNHKKISYGKDVEIVAKKVVKKGKCEEKSLAKSMDNERKKSKKKKKKDKKSKKRKNFR